MAEQDEISDEAFGQLRLKRKAGGTGYMFVTGPKPKCKKNPYQARIMNNRIGKTQSLGSFPTAHAAAVAVASALANGDNEDMASPQKRRLRGDATHSPLSLAFASMCTHACEGASSHASTTVRFAKPSRVNPIQVRALLASVDVPLALPAPSRTHARTRTSVLPRSLICR